MRLQTSTIPVHVQLPPPKSISFLPSGQTSLAETILRSTPWLTVTEVPSSDAHKIQRSVYANQREDMIPSTQATHLKYLEAE